VAYCSSQTLAPAAKLVKEVDMLGMVAAVAMPEEDWVRWLAIVEKCGTKLEER
jgi:hypothetical protein